MNAIVESVCVSTSWISPKINVKCVEREIFNNCVHLKPSKCKHTRFKQLKCHSHQLRSVFKSRKEEQNPNSVYRKQRTEKLRSRQASKYALARRNPGLYSLTRTLNILWKISRTFRFANHIFVWRGKYPDRFIALTLNLVSACTSTRKAQQTMNYCLS